MRNGLRSLGVHAIAISLVLVAMLGLSGAAFAQSSPWVQGTPRFLAIPGGNPEQAMADSIIGAQVPLFTNHFTFNSTNFNYTMVGKDPALGSATSKIKVRVIPLKFNFAGGLGGSLSALDPVCGDTQTAALRTEKSPLFKKQVYTPGGINVGKVGYIDAFQRANFWNFVSSTAPNYHIKLKTTELALQTISVPANKGSSSAGPCAHIGQVDINFFDNIAQGLITSLGIPSNELPLFLSYNTFWTQGGCCILGYHSVSNANQTYAVGAYSDAGIFSSAPNIQDIHALSHELAEWLDDPLVNNIVPAWGHIGQQPGCQNNLEVGDPVTGNGFNQVYKGKTFHPEDLVFLSWFARDAPSKGVAGFYSFTNSVGAPQVVCH